MNQEIKQPWRPLSDNPAGAKDVLSFSRYVAPLKRIVEDSSTETPYVIGIIGAWGSGKTTLMELIDKAFSSERNPSIWFNPWLYQQEDNLIVPLLNTIQTSLLDSKVARIKNSAGAIATVIAELLAGIAVKATTLGTVSLNDVEKRLDRYHTQRTNALSAIYGLRENLQNVVNEITNEGKEGRLVLFIDDLDRCVPVHVIQVLEAVKLFLDLKHVIIFIALDRHLVDKGIEAFYRELKLDPANIVSLSTEYMDKMIQLPIHLYPLSVESISNYVSELGCTDVFNENREIFELALLPNPRKIKRVLNIYSFTLETIKDHPEIANRIDREVLVKLVIIQQQWSSLYRDILKAPKLVSKLDKLYGRKIFLNREADWTSAELKLLKDKAEEYYKPGSWLEHLFKVGKSLDKVDLDEYWNLLG